MTPTEPIYALTVRSPSFGANGRIPIQHAASGHNIAPALSWGTVPRGTQSIAIIVEDPDAPGRTFVHWIVVGIPPHVHSLPAGARLPDGAIEGTNDHGTIGWYGPNPPSGCHRYVFQVYALGNRPSAAGIPSGSMTKHDFYGAIHGHVLARGELIGTYERKSRGVEARP